ncbi:phosphotransferase [Virgibacillus sp. C22-A2]|uniref:Phosphotransferase n=1 Tax=Virgibacillus tibetensis TaxID=3042313 RepID=A0ABU6KL01_9BACI|nr:phosphotransferase [Virgibacillus sp. C22-A2]
MVINIDDILLSKGARKFGANVSDLKLIGGFSNNVFECRGDSGNYILKYYLSTNYEKGSIESELDWILYLFKSGVNVTVPFPSLSGSLLEVVQLNNKEECWIVAFEKARGNFINVSNKGEWNSDTFYRWGKTLGEIHSLSKLYKPINKKDWNSGLLFSEANNVSEEIRRKWDMYINKLEKLPKDKNSYGMIHNDLHHKNFYINNKEIILFDFGDCEYNWFVYDIAIVLYHALQTINENDFQARRDFALQFTHSFLKGYKTENHVDSSWLMKIPFFLNYRQIYSYMYFSKYLTEEQKSKGRIKEALNSMKIKIENDIPYLDIQFIFFEG